MTSEPPKSANIAGPLHLSQWQFYGRLPTFTPFSNSQQTALGSTLQAIATASGGCPADLVGDLAPKPSNKKYNPAGQLVFYELSYLYQPQQRNGDGHCVAGTTREQAVLGAVFPVFDEKAEAQAAALPRARVFTLNEVDDLRIVSLTADSITLPNSKKAQTIAVGNVLVADIMTGAPEGILRVVTAVQVSAKTVLLSTGSAEFSQLAHAIKPTATRVRILAADTSTTPQLPELLQADTEGYIRLNFTGYLSNGLFATVNARVKPEFEWIWDKEWNAVRPKFMRLKMHLNMKDVKINGLVGLRSFVNLATLELPPIAVWAGVPIVFRNRLRLSASGTVAVGTSLDGGFALPSGSFTVGLDYVRDVGWTNLSATNAQIEFVRPRNISPNYVAAVEFPIVAFDSSPFGFGTLRFTAQAVARNQITYDQNLVNPLTVKMVPRTDVGIYADFFGLLEQSYYYTTYFPETTWYQGSVTGLLNNWAAPTDPGTPPRLSSNITDIGGTWAYNEISFLIDKGFLSGYSDNTFRPNNNVTRAEFAAMIVAVLNPAPKTACSSRNFNDISGHWAQAKILQAARACYLSGFPDGSFQPSGLVTKAQMLTALGNGMELTGKQTLTLWNLNDDQDIPSWASDPVANATENRLMVNYPVVATFSPNKNASRAETSATIYRVLMWRGNMSNSYDSPYLYLP
ncbi:MAG: S-layer homology domain-containing protein [Rhizobacter sp.]